VASIAPALAFSGFTPRDFRSFGTREQFVVITDTKHYPRRMRHAHPGGH